MRKKTHSSEEHNDGTYVVKKSRKSSVLAFIVCVLIAFVVWAYAVYTEDDEIAATDKDQQTDVLCAGLVNTAYTL